MTTVASILRVDDVVLDLQAKEAGAAIAETAARLRRDPRVLDWKLLVEGFQKVKPCLPASAEFAICLPHTRTDKLQSLVMSVGRSRSGILFPDSAVLVRYIFCIGVPHALAADYLRIVGLLARIVKDAEFEQALRAAANGTEFVEALSRFEAKL